MTDIDPALIGQWQASRSMAERVAARLAAELVGLPRWEPVEGTFRIAVRMNVSERTVRRAKELLADNGAIIKDGKGRAVGYYVA